MPSLPLTPSQTVGPYFAIGLSWLVGAELAGPGLEGQRVTVAGRVLDGDGRPVDDALLEIWQADAQGRYPSLDPAAHERPPAAPPRPEPTHAQAAPAFTGFGRIATDAAGAFRFTTVKPGPVAGPDGRTQAPHLAVTVFMRGLLRHLVTRVYFPNEPDANAADPVLGAVPAERRATLVARPARGSGDGGPLELVWDVRLQGPDETVFFDL